MQKRETVTRVELNAPKQQKIEAVVCTSDTLTHTHAALEVAHVETSVPEVFPVDKRCWIARVCSQFVRALTCGCHSY